MVYIQEMNVNIRVPPEDDDPSAIEYLVPANSPPAGFGSADEPYRPPSPIGLRLDLLVNGACILQARGFMQLAGDLVGWEEAFEYFTSLGQKVARELKVCLGARALTKFWIIVHLDVGDAVGADVVGLCPCGLGRGMRLIAAKGAWATLPIPKYCREAEDFANQPVLLVIPLLAVDQNDEAK